VKRLLGLLAVALCAGCGPAAARAPQAPTAPVPTLTKFAATQTAQAQAGERFRIADKTFVALQRSITPTPAPTSTPQDLAQARSILLASIDHYEQQFEEGKATLDKPYADTFAGLAAFKDPYSSASRLTDWRSSRFPGGADLSMIDAMARAGAFVSADNEPANNALEEWREAMFDADGATTDWWNVAVKWQIRTGTSAQLAAAEQQVRDALEHARAIVDVIAPAK
jgi:hypothetical protein